jgi:ADP-heptose:LPS heptosyltransferase
MQPPLRILAIQFKYFGDTVLMIPALRALRERWPDCALHALVSEEAAPLLQHLPGLARHRPDARQRGRAGFKKAWLMLRALRRERFDRSVDFGGNDRGALLSLLCGARERLGPVHPGGFVGRRFCYTRRVAPAAPDRHETLRLLHTLSAWGIAPPRAPEIQIHTDPAADVFAEKLLPQRKIICHLSAGRPKKEWAVRHWAAFHRVATPAGYQLAFTTGKGARAQSLANELRTLAPDASVLAPTTDLATFLAVLKRAEVFISGDTGPLHFAAGLGVPVIALFGPTSAAQWGPVGEGHQVLTGARCGCDGRVDNCQSANHCLAAIAPEQVFECLRNFFPPSRRSQGKVSTTCPRSGLRIVHRGR